MYTLMNVMQQSIGGSASSHQNMLADHEARAQQAAALLSRISSSLYLGSLKRHHTLMTAVVKLCRKFHESKLTDKVVCIYDNRLFSVILTASRRTGTPRYQVDETFDFQNQSISICVLVCNVARRMNASTRAPSTQQRSSDDGRARGFKPKFGDLR